MNNQRYLRNNLVDWFSQEAVQKLSVGIIGCGAVGNEVVKNLALLGVGRLDVYDFDKIEVHNLTKSVLFRESDIGRNKSDVAAERAMEIDPNISVRSFPGDFWDVMKLDVLQKYDVVICCVDNFEARLRINRLCVLLSVDLIDTGIDSRFVNVNVYPFSKSREVACYECNLPPGVYQQVEKRYSCGWLRRISYIEKIIPTTTITASIAGAIAASYALRLKAGDTKSKRIFGDSILGIFSQTDLASNPTCPTCSDREEVIIMKASPKIFTSISEFPIGVGEEIFLETSEPILIEYRCVDCHPQESEATQVFEKARNYDSRLAICPICENSSVKIEIKDRFSVAELSRKFKGYNFPCKYVSIVTNDKKYIINLEDQDECNS